MNNTPFGYKNLDNVGAFFNEVLLDPTLRVSQFLDTNYKAWRASDIISAIILIKNSNFDYGYDSNGDNLLTGVSVANQTNLNSALFVSYATRIYDIKTGGCISTYDSAMLYEKNAQVRYNDIQYISMQNNNANNTPDSAPSFWSQVTTSQYLGRKSILSNNPTSPNTKIDYTLADLLFNDGSFRTLNAGTVNLAINGLGGLDTGTIQANTKYYLYGIYNPTTNTSGVIASTSETNTMTLEYTGSNLPSGFTKSRYIGSVMTNISGNILPFTQIKNKFLLRTVITESFIGLNTSLRDFNITVPKNKEAMLCGEYVSNSGGNDRLIFKDLVIGQEYMVTRDEITGGLIGNNFETTINVNSSSQMQAKVLLQVNSISVYTRGWIDNDL
jgi:hypothetical protein